MLLGFGARKRVLSVAVAISCVAVLSSATNLATSEARASDSPVEDPANWPETVAYIFAPPPTTATTTRVIAQLAVRNVASLSLASGAGASVGALGVGLLVGGTIDHYFHVSCRISETCDPNVVSGAHNMHFVEWYYEPCLSGGTFCPPTADRAGHWFAKFHGDNINWTDPVCCSADFWAYTDPDPIAFSNGKWWFQDAKAAFGAFPVAPVLLSNDWYGIRLGRDEFSSLLVVDSDAAYSGQPHNYTIDPDHFPWGLSSPEGQYILAALLAGDDETDLEINRGINPNWDGPEFAMPNCYGLSVAACGSAITAAAEDAHLGEMVTIDLQTAPIDDSAVPAGHVIGSTPAAETVGHHTAVTLTTNSPDEQDPPGCTTRTDRPHWSTGGLTELAKAQVLCTYTGTVVVTSILWRCASEPTPGDEQALNDGQYDCEVAASTTNTRQVVKDIESPIPIYVPDTGAPRVIPNSDYFVAASFVPNGPPSWSQVRLEPPPAS
jgi:hypothetical protein